MELLNYLSSIIFLFLHVTGGGAFPRTLTAAEERDCLEKMRKGDDRARQKLIEHNLRLVAHIIKKFYATSTNQEDLISIGTIGLIKAIDSYDSSKTTKLSSYASKCIENEILMHFRSNKKSAQDISMNEPLSDTDSDGNSLTVMDRISVEDNILDIVDVRLKSEKLYVFINEVLSEREKNIIVMRYGLGGQKPLPQREVAKRLGISRSYVSRIEKKALDTLKKEFEK